eukprot:TRINITY_DN20919_c0_g1_i1.p1 TRINITY_DN20919_c0_g1~~TRINITY_DN20919_c0_g1_i1.p1  ORF type:complete len:262 (-),score=43.92 TRINITY_DN20919_c0_g1_i1:157-942(-)
MCSCSNWTPDSFSNVCELCDVKFTMFNRRHHCRACGILICHHCSSFLRLSQELGRVRICEECADIFENIPRLYESLEDCINVEVLDCGYALQTLETVEKFYSIIGNSLQHSRMRSLAAELLTRLVKECSGSLQEVISSVCMAGRVRLPSSEFVEQLVGQCERVYSMAVNVRWLRSELDLSCRPFVQFFEIMQALNKELGDFNEDENQISSSADEPSIFKQPKSDQGNFQECECEEDNMRSSSVLLSFSPTGSVHLSAVPKQ